MAGLVDHEAVLVDLRGRLLERQSWGAGQLRHLIDELERKHRVDESVDRAVLRRFGDHIADTVLGELPRSATPDPLPTNDRETLAAMDDGAAIPSHPMREATCQTPPPLSAPPAASRSSRPTPDSQPGSPSRPLLAAATSS